MLPWGAASALLAWGLTSRRFARGRAACNAAAGRMRHCLLTVVGAIAVIESATDQQRAMRL